MKREKIRSSIIGVMVFLLVIAGAGQGCITITTPEAPAPAAPTIETPVVTPTPINPEWSPPEASGETEPLPSIADVVALVKPSVVAITTEIVSYDFFNRPFTQEGAGSGWILDSDGIIVTNNHVVEGARTITVTMDDGRIFTADMQSLSTDALNDLAIVKIDARDLPALKRGDTSSLRVGDWVIAIGNALGQGIRATEGIVSRKGVSLPLSEGQTLYDLLETSAAINPGNSGGPLVNLAGEVVGITSAKVAQIGVEGMGYAISIDTAIPIVQELVNQGYIKRPWIGVDLLTVNQIVAWQFDLSVSSGILVRGIVAGSPADQAGLEPGDVIVSIGGESTPTVQELTRVLYASDIGQPIDVDIYRGSQMSTVQVTPTESPPPS